MLEGQIEERPHVQRHRHVEAPRDGAVGDGARQSVGGKGMGAAAIDVAGKLVGQDQQRQRAVGAFFPSRQRPPRGREMVGAETVGDGAVENRIMGEPAFGAGFPPECNDLSGA